MLTGCYTEVACLSRLVCIIVLVDELWDLPYWLVYIEGDLPNRVAVSTGSTVATYLPGFRIDWNLDINNGTLYTKRKSYS